MKAISIRAPWWWHIFHAGKDIENRSWPTKIRGTVLIHASGGWHWIDMLDDLEVANLLARSTGKPTTTLAPLRPYGGHLVGTVDIVGCVETRTSPWFFGRYGFQLENPVLFAEPIPFRGAQGFFHVPDDLVRDAIAAVTRP